MNGQWEMVETNIWKNTENPRKYKVILYYGRDSNGKMRKSSKVVNGTLKDARNTLILHESGRIKQNVAVPSGKKLTDLCVEWNTIGDGALTEVTTQTSNQNIQRHMIEYFGEMKIKDITTKKIREYLQYVVNKKGLSTNTANKHRAHLHTLFNYALTEPEEYGIYTNPVTNVKPFKKVKTKFEVFSIDEAKDLLLSLRKSDRHDLEVAVNIAFWCGVRREEACALKWTNVDLSNGIIRIREVRTTAKGTVVEREGTKNNTEREVGIAPWFHRILKEEFDYQQKMKKLLGDEYNDQGYVFCHDNGIPWHPNSLSNEYHKYLIKNGFKVIRYHDLRHTNLSMLMTKMSAVDVAMWGGHQQVSTTTDIYGHSFNHTVEDGVKYIDDMMKL